MSTPILATKLYIPPPQRKVVPRPRLMERLNEALDTKLTLISAPAGFGKTTIVSQWVADCECLVAWLSLDEGDNDLTRFLTYVIAALQTIQPNIGEGVLTVLQSAQPMSREFVLTALLNEIITIPDHFVLILDDYHVIDAQYVDDAVTFMLEHLPPNMHLVINTREDPDLPLSRFRVRNHLTELRIADLRFTPVEAAAFLNQGMGLALSADDIAALDTRTEGWIAGLQLAAISMQGHPDTADFIESFTGSHRFVLDYLVEEVLHQQPEHVQQFLLYTSVLDRLCGSLCDTLLRDHTAPGQETLEYLERANLLVVPLDDQRKWYRYHHLFADVLQARLLQEQPHQVQNLHQWACDWYKQNDLPFDAIHHALAAEDYECAAALIELVWSEIRKSCFQSPTWLAWVEALPDEMVQTRPVLSVGCAWEYLNFGELEAAEAPMHHAERWLEPPPDTDTISAGMVVVNEAEFPMLRASLANARAFHAAARGDNPDIVIHHARRALDMVTETDYYTLGIAGSLLGLAYWARGELEIAYQSIADAMTSLQRAGNLLFAVAGTFSMADIRIAQGRLNDAIWVYERALQIATEYSDVVLQGTADLYLGLSELHHEQGDADLARQCLQKSEELGEQVALPDWHYRYCLLQAQIKHSHGDLDGALNMLEEAQRLYYNTPIPPIRPIPAWKVQISIQQGKLTKAQTWVQEQGLSVDDELNYLRMFEYLTLVRLLIAIYKNEGKPHTIDSARQLLQRLLEVAEAGEWTGNVIEILILQALVYHAQGDVSAALIPLQQALTVAEPQGYIRHFIDEGIPLRELLLEARKHGILPNYVNHLLVAFAGEQHQPDSKTILPPAPPLGVHVLIEPLSQRELEILQLIAQGLSNREISERLFLALSTVKGHNRNIFDKLQVQRRTEAVAHARDLGLL